MAKQHKSKDTARLLASLKSKGFTVGKKTKSGTIKITPPPGVDGPCYHTHGTESALHQMRRDMMKLYKVSV